MEGSAAAKAMRQEQVEGRVLGGEVRGPMGLDHGGPGGDFAFTLSEREPLMSSGASRCSQASSGCIWGTDRGSRGSRGSRGQGDQGGGCCRGLDGR